MPIKKRRHVPRLGFSDSGFRHRSLRRECSWRHDPSHQIVGRVLQHTTDIDPLAELIERGGDLAVRAGDGRDGMASAATIAPDEARRMFWVATGERLRDSI